MTELASWDLSNLYSSSDDRKLAEDLNLSSQNAKSFEDKYQNKIETISADELTDAIKEYEKIEDKLGRIATYAQLLFAADSSKQETTKFYQDVMDKVSDISNHLIFFALEILELSEEKMNQMLNSSKALNNYAPWLANIRFSKPYILSKELEKLLHDKQTTGEAAWVRLFDETHAGLKYPLDGKELSSAEIYSLLSDKNREVRKNAAKAIGKVLEQNAGLFARITNVLAKDKAIEDKWRGYKRPISSRNVANLIEDETVQALVAAVKESLPRLSHRYYSMKAKWMGLDKLEYWDRNAPLPDSPAEEIPIAKGKQIVLEAYAEFAPEMSEIAAKFFENKWIDLPPREGKDSGAFSHPCVPSANPYILMNYQGKIRDVMTLAHELGHGVHQFLAAEKGLLMADTPLTVAETASVFGEMLTFKSILKNTTDVKQRKAIIAHKVEDMLNTVVRQIAFLEFERLVHDARLEGEIPLERICEFWLQVQKESLGDAFNFDDEYKYYWSYIPHFIHTPFYVYAYAFGDCLVNSLYSVYEQGKVAGFKDKYINALKSGGTLRYNEMLQPFGLNANDPNFWKQGLKVIEGMIDELA